MKKRDYSKYTGIYGSWYAMKQRCGNPNNKQYKDYGGRGIDYPEKWESFIGYKEDMGKTYQKGLIIDRINVNQNYSKENCRWVTRKISNRNKRRHLWVNYQNRKITLAEYAELTGIKFQRLRDRYARGYPMNLVMYKGKFHRFGNPSGYKLRTLTS